MVASLEVDDGARVAEGLVKQLTGGDTVRARFMYQESFEFAPAFKLWLAANSRPRVRADDGAMWRRIVQVPCTEAIPAAERNPDVKRHLTTDPRARQTILAWAVRGCGEWLEQGLAVPERVRAYTADYRRENDPLAEWLEACCVLDPQAVTSSRDLRESYVRFAEANGEKPVRPNRMGEPLRAHRCEQMTRDGRRFWRGVRLGSDPK